MIVILSGEGPTDFGCCNNMQESCEQENFQIGPMTVLLDKLLKNLLGYSLYEFDAYVCVTEQALIRRKKQNKRMALVGKKRGQETGYFFNNAWMLGEIAQEIEIKRSDTAMAILFRDSDGTNSQQAQQTWHAKRQSMQDGFTRAGFERGVPMLPKPKSEAWLLCLAKGTQTNCQYLEDISGNDAAPDSAKAQLANCLNMALSRQSLVDWLQEHDIAFDKLCSMPSFAAFFNKVNQITKQ